MRLLLANCEKIGPRGFSNETSRDSTSRDSRDLPRKMSLGVWNSIRGISRANNIIMPRNE